MGKTMKALIMISGLLLSGCIELGQKEDKKQELNEVNNPVNEPLNPVNEAINPINLSWTTPNRMEDEKELEAGNISAYYVQWGESKNNLDKIVEVSAEDNAYTVSGLTAGTYYFSVSVETLLGERSALSNIVSKEVH